MPKFSAKRLAQQNAAVEGCSIALVTIFFWLLLFVVFAVFEGWLVTIVLGWFGFHFTLFQGWVIALTVGLITNGGGIRWSDKK